jgi:hypothetical protein
LNPLKTHTAIFAAPLASQIGVTFRMHEVTGHVIVFKLIGPESPAARAGIEVGDRLLAIGSQAKGMALLEEGGAADFEKVWHMLEAHKDEPALDLRVQTCVHEEKRSQRKAFFATVRGRNASSSSAKPSPKRDRVLPFDHAVVSSKPEHPEPAPTADGSAVFDPVVPIIDVPAPGPGPGVTKPADDPKRREHLEMAFAKFDTDGSGSLDAEELARLLSVGNSELSRAKALERAAAIITKFDFDGNGLLDVRQLARKSFTTPLLLTFALPSALMMFASNLPCTD